MDAATVLPVLAVSLVIFIVIIKLFQGIRVKLPKRVNCWFCNNNTSVPYKYQHSWKCPSCDQYNGFGPDGGYNRVLHAQYNVSLNKSVYVHSPKKPSPAKNGLCKFCNINQELKVAQLAAFVPIKPSNFDDEVDMYRDQLDRSYKLCDKCETVLSEKLLKQKSWLKNTYQDLESFLDKKPVTLKQIKSRRIFYAYTTAIISAGLFLFAASHVKLGKEMINYAALCLQRLNTFYTLPEFLLLPDITAKLEVLYPWFRVINVSLLLNGLCTAIQLLEALEQWDVPSALNVVMWLILSILSGFSMNIGRIIVEMLVGGVSFVVSLMHIRDLKLTGLNIAQNVFSTDKTVLSSKIPERVGISTPERFGISTPERVGISTPERVGISTPDRVGISPSIEAYRVSNTSPSIPAHRGSTSSNNNFDHQPVSDKKINKPKSSQSISNSKPSQPYTRQNSSVLNPNPKVIPSFTGNHLGQNSLKIFPEDLGLSKLKLGTTKSQNKQNPMFEVKSYGSRISNNQFSLSPPKLSIESFYSDCQTRSSSRSSGFCSSASQHCSTRPPSVVGDFDTISNDGCSVAPFHPSQHASLYQYPVHPMYPVQPYFHFAAQYHRMFETVPPQQLLNLSLNSNNSDSTYIQFIKNTLYSLPIMLLVLSNLGLVWIVIYKEFIVK